MTLKEKSLALAAVGIWIPTLSIVACVAALALAGLYVKARLRGVVG